MAEYHYHLPLDPDCPGAARIARWAKAGHEDPMTEHYGAGDVVEGLRRDRERRHLSECERCRGYGAANIEVRD